ncbi:MAG TPA: FtsX-like permease family protein [Parachlamydiaceae bacterium]|nr:FtsX-like permease family protein [Parachlamydiaceae bacterium]
MFELSVAKKYLAPRWKQLSVSIISLISTLVISLVVWLIVVFFSVTNGLEKGWIEKLTSITAPVRITPTAEYENSYYYLIDTISESSHYSAKSIGEKLNSPLTNPYNENLDEEIPQFFSPPLLNAEGTLKDLVKEADYIIKNLSTNDLITVSPYEATMAHLRLKLIRGVQESIISQSVYLSSFNLDSFDNKTVLPLNLDSLNRFFQLLAKNEAYFQPLLESFLAQIKIEELKPVLSKWAIPESLFPKNGSFQALKVTHPNLSVELLLTKDNSSLNALKKQYEEGGFKAEIGEVQLKTKQLFWEEKPLKAALKMVEPLSFKAKIVETSIKKAKEVSNIFFEVSFEVQSIPFKGTLNFKDLEIARVEKMPKTLFLNGLEAVLLPKSFFDAGVLPFDALTLSFYSPTMSSLQEQQVPAYVAGFYDPGLIPLGGKVVLASSSLVSEIRASSGGEVSGSSGLNVRFNDLNKSKEIKKRIVEAFEQAGLSPYFKVETYREYEFAKDILEQLESDKTLFSLISAIIIIVACSNIISMLIIMVNDKKTEIGILRSMGASSFSIALIFGISGIAMGTIGSLIGILAAYLTLKNMDFLILALNKLQGHNAFNPIFYGDALPNEISQEALFFVMACTVIISLVAALVPAFKATLLRPAAILKSE